MNAQSPHKWRFTHGPAMFSLSLSQLLLVGWDGGRVCKLVGKADLMSDHLDSKQSRESVDLPLTFTSLLTYHLCLRSSSEVWCLLLDLDSFGDTDLLGMFCLFLKRTADILAPPS